MKNAISTKGPGRMPVTNTHPSGPRFDLWMKPCGVVLDDKTDHHKYRMMRQEAAKRTNAQA